MSLLFSWCNTREGDGVASLGKKIIAFGVENVYGLMLWDNLYKNWFNFIKTLLNSLVKLFKIGYPIDLAESPFTKNNFQLPNIL